MKFGLYTTLLSQIADKGTVNQATNMVNDLGIPTANDFKFLVKVIVYSFIISILAMSVYEIYCQFRNYKINLAITTARKYFFDKVDCKI